MAESRCSVTAIHRGEVVRCTRIAGHGSHIFWLDDGEAGGAWTPADEETSGSPDALRSFVETIANAEPVEDETGWLMAGWIARANHVLATVSNETDAR